MIAILTRGADTFAINQRLKFIQSIIPSIFGDESHRILTRLQKQVDPKLAEYLSAPWALLLQEKRLSIAFYDVSGFSFLCESLLDYPMLIAGFLGEYFDIATRIIHKNGGVVDTFLGMELWHTSGSITVIEFFPMLQLMQ